MEAVSFPIKHLTLHYQALLNCEQSKLYCSDLRRSASIACGASVFEVCLQVPIWASQVLRQLATDLSYRSLIMLGVASVQGLSVASFNEDDAERLLFFCTRQEKEHCPNDSNLSQHPSWLMPPAPLWKRLEPSSITKSINCGGLELNDNGNCRQKFNIAAIRPIPHAHRHKMVPFSGLSEGERYDGDHGKANTPVAPKKHSVAGAVSVTHRKSLSNSFYVLTTHLFSIQWLVIK